jgi:hypothetical protein
MERGSSRRRLPDPVLRGREGGLLTGVVDSTPVFHCRAR